jgi:hypothetical protein
MKHEGDNLFTDTGLRSAKCVPSRRPPDTEGKVKFWCLIKHHVLRVEV